MRSSRIRSGLAVMFAASALVAPVAVQAVPQLASLRGRAVLEHFIPAPPLTNVVAIPTAVGYFSPSNYVPVRSPIKTVIRVYQAKSGRLVRTVNTDDSGRFVVLLQPGLYRLEPAIMRDGRVLEGNGILMGLNQLIQTAPIQTVRVSGFRPLSVTVIYHAVWPGIRVIPYRPIRLDPVTEPVGNIPLPQPGARLISSGALSSISGRTLPPLPPTRFTPPDSPLVLPQAPLPIPQR